MKHLAALSKWPAYLAASAVLLCLAVGCSSTGSFKGQTTGTDVSLNQKNYRVIKPGAMGKSYGFRLLGIIPFANPTYATAKADLYKSAG
ncbi:MAG TPA: hypothetical protein VG077_07405, partial [Verrucomicrobiae bacterium]|nr:hypothetical protein [Verrucomicrobiae bacterium]